MFELLIAFGAGLISFLSPCVLPLIPGYISFISGASLNELTCKKKNRYTTIDIIFSRLFFCFYNFWSSSFFFGSIIFTKFTNVKNICRSSYNNIFTYN